MELHPFHVTLYNKWDFRFLSKGDFKVGKRVLSFLVVKMIWSLNNFFSLLAKFCVICPLYWTKNRGLSSLLLRLLTFLRGCSFWGGFGVTFSFVTILSNVSLTILEDHSVGYWFSVQISWFFLRATSKDCQSLVALKILCTVPWITFLLCCNGAQLIMDYAGISWLLIPMTADFSIFVLVYV